MLKLQFIFVLYLFLKLSSCVQRVIVTRFDVCETSPTSTIKWYYTSFQNYKSGFCGFSAKFENMKYMRRIRISIKAERCSNKDAPDTCQKFTDIQPLDTCTFLDYKTSAWANVTQNFVPPVQCPFQKGIYILKNGTINPEIPQPFPMYGWHWKTRFGLYDQRNHLFTLCCDFDITK